jgi:hypothetical protein
MSRDQKPGKLRVVGGTAAPVAASDGAAGGETGAGAAASGAVAEAVRGDSGSALLVPAFVFLIACALGGALVALLGLAR